MIDRMAQDTLSKIFTDAIQAAVYARDSAGRFSSKGATRFTPEGRSAGRTTGRVPGGRGGNVELSGRYIQQGGGSSRISSKPKKYELQNMAGPNQVRVPKKGADAGGGSTPQSRGVALGGEAMNKHGFKREGDIKSIAAGPKGPSVGSIHSKDVDGVHVRVEHRTSAAGTHSFNVSVSKKVNPDGSSTYAYKPISPKNRKAIKTELTALKTTMTRAGETPTFTPGGVNGRNNINTFKQIREMMP